MSTLRHEAGLFCWFLGVLVGTAPLAGQDPCEGGGPLYINEVVADNRGLDPRDIRDGSPDMIELYYSGEGTIELGSQSAAASYYLSAAATFDPLTAWRFPLSRLSRPTTMVPDTRLVIFCDGASDGAEADCELHASFGIASDGSEPITLWGPEGADGERPVVDQVWLPPLRGNVSFGRRSDGCGPTPVPLDETFEHFVFNPGDSETSPPSFGICSSTGASCFLGVRRFCGGAPNGPGDNLEPRIRRVFHTTNSPAAGEGVELVVEVRDDEEPVAPNIARAEIVYRVELESGEVTADEIVTLTMDDGVRTAAGPPLLDDDGQPILGPDGRPIPTGSPLDRFTLWRGVVPGQPAGSRVMFYFRVEDAEGLSSTSPRPLCCDGAASCPQESGCDREFGGPNCLRDLEDRTCVPDEPDGEDGEGGGAGAVIGRRYIACSALFTYAVDYTTREDLRGIVINEVVPRQTDLLVDDSEPACRFEDNCSVQNPDCCRSDEDFIEMLNTSGKPVDLSGCWLSDSYFTPRGWQFPPGSIIPPERRFIVWLDRDGARCPDENDRDPPCFWECPDPTDPPRLVFHTNFAVDADGDQVFLFDTEENDYGLIHGLDFGDPTSFPGFSPVDLLGMPNDNVLANQSLSLIPDGDPNGCWVIVPRGSPKAPNEAPAGLSCGGEPIFRRGDADENGEVELTDAIFILNYRFLGGRRPSCEDAADADDDGEVGITDAIRILGFLFLGQQPVAPPSPACGVDVEPDELAECEYDVGRCEG